MKKIITLFFLTLLLAGCKYKWSQPEPDSGWVLGPQTYFTNNYILSNIFAYNCTSNNSKTNTLKNNDTISYTDLFLCINFTGYLITNNEYFNHNNYTEQKFFINKIRNFNIYTNGKLLNYSDFTVFFKDKRGHYISKSYYKEPLGYSPLKIYFNFLPELNKKIRFKVEIEDDKGNVFTAVTDSVFVTE